MVHIPLCFSVCKAVTSCMTHFAWKNGFKIRKLNERTCLKCVHVTTCALIRNKTTELFPCAGDRQVCMFALNTHMQIYLHSKRLSNKASHFHIEMLLALCIQNIWGFSLLQFIGELSMWVSSPFKCSKQICCRNNWTIHLNDSVKYYAETIKMIFHTWYFQWLCLMRKRWPSGYFTAVPENVSGVRDGLWSHYCPFQTDGK